MQDQNRTEQKTNCINNKKWLSDMRLGAGLAFALLLMYIHIYVANDGLFSELKSISKDREFFTDSIKSINTDSYDPKVLDIMKVVPISFTEKGITYVEKGFSRFASSLPWWSLPFIILDAAILFVLVTILVLFFGKVSRTNSQIEHKKDPYVVYEVLLFIISFICLFAPSFIIFGVKVATTAIAGFYAGLSTWTFHLLRCPYNIQFRVTEEGPIDKEKCKMMAEYYSKLLSFVLGIFSVVTIGLVWYVSQLLTETSSHIPKLLKHQLTFLFLNDTYGSAWLLLIISKQLVRNYFDIVSRFESQHINGDNHMF